MTQEHPSSASAPSASAGARFAAVFGREARCVFAAPGRVNLMGEFTDVSDGWVLPFALGMTVQAAAARRDDNAVVASTGLPGVSGEPLIAAELTDLSPAVAAGWSRYVLGVIWAFRTAGYPVDRGLEIHVESDLPTGAGLSSSAALECSVALAVDELFGLGCSREELAALARRAENDFAGVPCGIMDQTASLFGIAGHALLIDTRSRQISPVRCDPPSAGLDLLVIDTGVHHELGSSGYADRRAACERAAAQLRVRSLRDVANPAYVERIKDVVIRRRARHIVTDNRRVHAAARDLEAGSARAIGPLLTEAHRSLRDDFEVSCAELDTAVDAAIGAGALGARMVGGGFGGSAIALVEADEASAVADAVAEAFAASGFSAPRIFPATPSAGAHRLA
jgi:galactokinase